MSHIQNEAKREENIKQYLSAERLNIIRECVLAAHDLYWEKHKKEGHILMSRTKANIINDYIVDNIKNKFENDPDVHSYYIRKQSFRISICNGAVIVRFKKMDKKMRAHNIPTQQALDFSEQLTLFGSSVNINAGYVTNGLENKVIIACPENNSHNHWVWEIEPMTEIDNNVIPIVEPEPLPISPVPIKRKAVPRREKQKKHEDVK